MFCPGCAWDGVVAGHLYCMMCQLALPILQSPILPKAPVLPTSCAAPPAPEVHCGMLVVGSLWPDPVTFTKGVGAYNTLLKKKTGIRRSEPNKHRSHVCMLQRHADRDPNDKRLPSDFAVCKYYAALAFVSGVGAPGHWKVTHIVDHSCTVLSETTQRSRKHPAKTGIPHEVTKLAATTKEFSSSSIRDTLNVASGVTDYAHLQPYQLARMKEAALTVVHGTPKEQFRNHITRLELIGDADKDSTVRVLVAPQYNPVTHAFELRFLGEMIVNGWFIRALIAAGRDISHVLSWDAAHLRTSARGILLACNTFIHANGDTSAGIGKEGRIILLVGSMVYAGNEDDAAWKIFSQFLLSVVDAKIDDVRNAIKEKSADSNYVLTEEEEESLPLSLNHPEMVHMSDRQKGLVEALGYYDEATLVVCLQHATKNLKDYGHCNKEGIDLFTKMAHAETQHLFDVHLAEFFLKANALGNQYFRQSLYDEGGGKKSKQSKWCSMIATSDGTSLEGVRTSINEPYFAAMKAVRAKPMYAVTTSLVQHQKEKLEQAQAGANTMVAAGACASKFVTNAADAAWSASAKDYSIDKLSDGKYNIFKNEDGSGGGLQHTITINVAERVVQCSNRCVQMNGFLCVEGFVILKEYHQNYREFLPTFLRSTHLQKVLRAATEGFGVVPNATETNNVSAVSRPLVPPHSKPKSGAPKKRRITRESHNAALRRWILGSQRKLDVAKRKVGPGGQVAETKGSKCGLCGLRGHNRGTCGRGNDGLGRYMTSGQQEMAQAVVLTVDIGPPGTTILPTEASLTDEQRAAVLRAKVQFREVLPPPPSAPSTKSLSRQTAKSKDWLTMRDSYRQQQPAERYSFDTSGGVVTVHRSADDNTLVVDFQCDEDCNIIVYRVRHMIMSGKMIISTAVFQQTVEEATGDVDELEAQPCPDTICCKNDDNVPVFRYVKLNSGTRVAYGMMEFSASTTLLPASAAENDEDDGMGDDMDAADFSAALKNEKKKRNKKNGDEDNDGGGDDDDSDDDADRNGCLGQMMAWRGKFETLKEIGIADVEICTTHQGKALINAQCGIGAAASSTDACFAISFLVAQASLTQRVTVQVFDGIVDDQARFLISEIRTDQGLSIEAGDVDFARGMALMEENSKQPGTLLYREGELQDVWTNADAKLLLPPTVAGSVLEVHDVLLLVQMIYGAVKDESAPCSAVVRWKGHGVAITLDAQAHQFRLFESLSQVDSDGQPGEGVILQTSGVADDAVVVMMQWVATRLANYADEVAELTSDTVQTSPLLTFQAWVFVGIDAKRPEGIPVRLDGRIDRGLAAMRVGLAPAETQPAKDNPVSGLETGVIMKSLTASQVKEADDFIFMASGAETEHHGVKGNAIPSKSLLTLRNGMWLNDNVLNCVTKMLTERDERVCTGDRTILKSFWFSTHFFSKLAKGGKAYNFEGVARWTNNLKGITIFDCGKVAVPHNVGGNHWAGVICFMQQKRIEYYDGYSGRGLVNGEGLATMRLFLRYLSDEHRRLKLAGDFVCGDWVLVPSSMRVPAQSNSFDCGALLLTLFDFMGAGLTNKLTYDQNMMVEQRKRFALHVKYGTMETDIRRTRSRGATAMQHKYSSSEDWSGEDTESEEAKKEDVKKEEVEKEEVKKEEEEKEEEKKKEEKKKAEEVMLEQENEWLMKKDAEMEEVETEKEGLMKNDAEMEEVETEKAKKEKVKKTAVVRKRSKEFGPSGTNPKSKERKRGSGAKRVWEKSGKGNKGQNMWQEDENESDSEEVTDSNSG